MTGDIVVEAYHQQEGCGKLYVNEFAVDDSGTFHIGLACLHPFQLVWCFLNLLEFVNTTGAYNVHASPLSLYLDALVDAPLFAWSSSTIHLHKSKILEHARCWLAGGPRAVVSREILKTPVEIQVFPSPTSYMLTSFSFPLLTYRFL